MFAPHGAFVAALAQTVTGMKSPCRSSVGRPRDNVCTSMLSSAVAEQKVVEACLIPRPCQHGMCANSLHDQNPQTSLIRCVVPAAHRATGTRSP